MEPGSSVSGEGRPVSEAAVQTLPSSSSSSSSFICERDPNSEQRSIDRGKQKVEEVDCVESLEPWLSLEKGRGGSGILQRQINIGGMRSVTIQGGGPTSTFIYNDMSAEASSSTCSSSSGSGCSSSSGSSSSRSSSSTCGSVQENVLNPILISPAPAMVGVNPMKQALHDKVRWDKMLAKSLAHQQARSVKPTLDRYKRDEAKILEWENLPKEKAAVIMKEIELKIEEKRAKSLVRTQTESSWMYKKVGQKKANADIPRSLESLKSAEDSQSTRKHDERIPNRCLFF